MSNFFQRFWTWYERYEFLNLAIATILFSWQLVHLVWLTTDVVFVHLLGTRPILTSSVAQLLLALVDYTEIPALITTSLVYINQLRKISPPTTLRKSPSTNTRSTSEVVPTTSHNRGRAIRNLILLNSQWFHLFWITDEFVVGHFAQGHTSLLTGWVAYLAIFIDYLELPVMAETLKHFWAGLRSRTMILPTAGLGATANLAQTAPAALTNAKAKEK